MKLITEYHYDPKKSEEENDREAEWLLETIRDFAMMRNDAWWRSRASQKCCVCRGFDGELQRAKAVKINGGLEKTISEWCHQLPEGREDESLDLRVEINDIDWGEGGMHIRCFRGEVPDEELYVLPLDN